MKTTGGGHFPKLLSSQIAFDIARTIVDGFDKHYRLFREISRRAKQHFEAAQWHTAQTELRERISYYDRRVRECVMQLEDDYADDELTDEVWREVKLHTIGLLTDHKQPELAETFFNSVCCKMLHRAYFHNDFIFVRPAISTDYIDNAEAVPSYRVAYPARDGLQDSIEYLITCFDLQRPFANLKRDTALVAARLQALFGDGSPQSDRQLHVLSSLFYRNQGAYMVGKCINGNREYPFVVPILHNREGLLELDAVLCDIGTITVLFSFTRAYFMVDFEVAGAYVQFVQTLLPTKPHSEIYTMFGLQKHGKTLFYRDFLHHLRHSSDCFDAAPGIRGLVMVVFALASLPYVFKVIKDHFPAPKETTRALVMAKYLLVKNHDRVGRMADTLEYSDVAFPRQRFSETLLAELKAVAPSIVEEDGDNIVIRHLYIERRMTPLNMWLSTAQEGGNLEALEHGIVEYGNAIKDLVAANIFPGDMLYKNFGMTRHGRVVFYDYDEIETMTDCNFRALPQPRNEEEEMASEPWYRVARNDVFPEQFGVFLLGNDHVRQAFMRHHADLLTVQFWQHSQQKILEGQLHQVRPYPQRCRLTPLA